MIKEPLFIVEFFEGGETVVRYSRDGEPQVACGNLKDKPVVLKQGHEESGFTEFVAFDTFSILTFRNPVTLAIKACFKKLDCSYFCRP